MKNNNPIEAIAVNRNFATWSQIDSAKKANDRIPTRNKIMSENLRKFASKKSGGANE